MIRRLLAALILLLAPAAALAQSTPGLIYGQIPTDAQWNFFFSQKQNTLGYVPLNNAGGVMTGLLTLAPSGTTSAGLNCGVGIAPTSPNNGDVWCSSSGMYVQINGATVGPFVSAAGVVTTLEINLNGAALPTPLTGSLIQAQQANGVVNRVELDSLAAPSTITGIRKDGTAASPTAVLSGDELLSLNGYGWNGSAAVGSAVSFRSYAAETFASGHQGTYARIATTPIASTTLTDVIGIENDGGITVPPTVAGGSKGVGSINVAQAAGIYNGGVAPTGVSTNGYLRAAAPSVTVNGTLCTLGSTCAPTATASSITVGTTTIASGTTGRVVYDNAGVIGEYPITGTGNVALSASPTFTGTLTAVGALFSSTVGISTGSALAFAVGISSSNPALNVDTSTGSQVAGLNIKGAVTGGTVALSVIDTGSNTNLSINAKGTGTITIGNVSTGAIVNTAPTTLSSALTYGGVTLSNSVQGIGSMVLSLGPIIAGLTVTGSFNANGLVTMNDLVAGTSDTTIGYWGSTTASAIAINNCSNALTYSTSSHTWGCNTLAGTGTVSIASGGLALTGGGTTVGLTTGRQTLPTHQVFTTGGGTYTTPANALYIRVRIVGGGGGGGGSGSSGAGTGGTGGVTTFGTSLFTANGGVGGPGGSASNNVGGAGGTATGCTIDLAGTNGASVFSSPTTSNLYGGKGGGSAFFGGGSNNAVGVANTGAGGSGAAFGTGAAPAAGGGGGGSCEGWINSPSSTYPYTVGPAGTAGVAGTSGAVGFAGAVGLIVVDEFYN